MSITIHKKSQDQVTLTFNQWRESLSHDTVLLESLAMIATIQDDNSICVIALMDSITFTVYPTMKELINDLDIREQDDVTVISEIEISYSKLME